MVVLEKHLKSKCGVNQEAHERVFLLTVLTVFYPIPSLVHEPRNKKVQGCDNVSKWTSDKTSYVDL